jgi:hypothetical protein
MNAHNTPEQNETFRRAWNATNARWTAQQNQPTRTQKMEDQRPNHDSTAGEIIDFYDSHLNGPTLKELADMTGRSIPYLKGLLMHPGKVKA